MSKEYIDTCYVCNTLQRTYRHYSELMCNNCYHLILRLRKKHRQDTGEELTRDQFLTRAISKRDEMRGSGKWESSKNRPTIKVGILR